MGGLVRGGYGGERNRVLGERGEIDCEVEREGNEIEVNW